MEHEGAPIRVLLVDPQQLSRLGLRMLLESDPAITVVGEARDAASALRLARELTPDVVVTDVRLEAGSDGVELTAAISRAFPAMRVLILTAIDRDDYAFAALRAGAQGFLLKDSDEHDLRCAVHRVARGDGVLAPRVSARLLELFGSRLPSCADTTSGRTAEILARDPRLIELTEREFEIFQLVAEGLSNLELSARLHLSESTIKTHIGRILMKLQVRDRVQLVVLGYETGVVRPVPAGERQLVPA
jgi:DNA-binding NarL/FixJ family response regulator